MTYSISTTRNADRDLRRLDARIRRQVMAKMFSLRENPRPQDVKLLRGRERIYRVDSGEYRILYTIDDGRQAITILAAKHRKDAYRRF